ncbi:MAG TPA: hypothetical protein VMZ22_12560 [Acidimicrobiales bacterium]|nr:hypothetical protein [Acidimicrobiales bacterium]
MKRRSLDALFSLGFVVAAALLVAVGYVMNGYAVDTDRYIRHQLDAQRIAFPPQDTLTPAELARPCVVANAGRWVRTPGQAQCYADDFLGTRIDALVKQGTGKEQLFRGETQRGLLLTTQMFDEIGDRSRALTNIFYSAAALLALLAVASLMHRAFVANGEVVQEKRPPLIKRHKTAATA